MTAVQTPPVEKQPEKAAVSARVRGERRLGLYLTLPSYIVMLLVTAYPWVTHWCCRCTTSG